MTAHAEATVGWADVEREIARLAAARASFAASYKIVAYAPGWRIQLETASGVGWIDIATIQTCWETFERLGRICRRDVLEPGRRSAFMMALFALVPGVLEEAGPETYLVLPTA